MEDVVPGATARHWDRQAGDVTPADETHSGNGSRLLQWIGLVAVAAAAGVVLAFVGAPATEVQAAVTQASQVAKPPKPPKSSTSSNGGPQEPSKLDAIRQYIRGVKDPAARQVLDDYVKWAEKHPKANCLLDCFFDRFITTNRSGAPPGAMSAVAHILACGIKCVGDKETLDELKKKLGEWQRDGGQREKFRKAEQAAKDRVKDLKQKVNEKRATQAELDKAQKELAEATAARKNYERSRALQDRADRLREQAAKAKNAKERDRLLRAAQRKEEQAKNVREGRDRNDNGPDRTNTRDGGTGKSKVKVPAWMKKLFRNLGYFAIAQEILDDVQAGRAEIDRNLRASLLQLQQYIEEHPNEADELAALFRQRQLPLLDPERMAEFLHDWDADHYDVTGDEITSECEIVTRLGGGYCDPEQIGRERLDPPRDQNRDTPIENRRPTLDDGPDSYQPERTQPDGYQPYQPGPYEIGAADVIVVEPDGASDQRATDNDKDEKGDNRKTRHDSPNSEPAKPTKSKSKTSRSTTKTTGKNTAKSTGKSTGSNKGNASSTKKTGTKKADTKKADTKKTNKGPSDLDRARDELAREKSPQAKADGARDALIEDKKQLSARDKV